MLRSRHGENGTAGGICPKGTTASVQVFVSGTRRTMNDRGRGEVYMFACTNTSNFPGFMSQLLPMLRSVRIVARASDGHRLRVALHDNTFVVRVPKNEFPLRLVAYDSHNQMIGTTLWKSASPPLR